MPDREAESWEGLEDSAEGTAAEGGVAEWVVMVVGRVEAEG